MATPTEISVWVEQKHIDAGVPGNAKFCPLSLAIRDTPAADVFEAVYTEYADVTCDYTPDSYAIYRLPQRASDFVTEFDCIDGGNKEIVRPFTFTMTLYPEVSSPDVAAEANA